MANPSHTSGDSHHPAARESRPDQAGLGALLREARERRGLTIEQLARETRISQRHLDALEHDDLGAVPDGFYRRAEVRTYARAVHLDESLAVARLEQALRPPVVRDKAPARGGTTAGGSSKALLIAGGVAIAAAIVWLAVARRAPAADRPDPAPVAAEAAPSVATPMAPPAPPVDEQTPRDTVVGASNRTPAGEMPPAAAPATDPATQVAPVPGTIPAPAATAPVPLPQSSGGDAAGVKIEMAAAQPPAEPLTALVVTTQPAGAQVTVNGIGWGASPVAIRYVPPGTKRVRVSKDGYTTEERVVTVGEGVQRKVEIRLRAR